MKGHKEVMFFEKTETRNRGARAFVA